MSYVPPPPNPYIPPYTGELINDVRPQPRPGETAKAVGAQLAFVAVKRYGPKLAKGAFVALRSMIR